VWGSYGDRRSVPNTTSDALRTKRWEQRAEFSASQPVQEPRTSAGSFLRVWPQRLGAAEGAMGGGKHFRIRPPDKDDCVPSFLRVGPAVRTAERAMG